MEKIYSPEKSSSFRSRHHRRKSESSPRTPRLCSIDEFSDIHHVSWRESVEEIDDSLNINNISDQIDQFIATISSLDKESYDPLEIPKDVEIFSKIVESKIAKFCSPNNGSKFGKIEKEDIFFISAINRLSNLTNAFADFPSCSNTTPYHNRTSMVLQRAMLFLEEEFKNLLENSRTQDYCVLRENKSANEEKEKEKEKETEKVEYSIYSPEVVTKITKIVSTMFSAGYRLECCHVYTNARTIALHEELINLGFEVVVIEDVQWMTWEQLEDKIAMWIKALRYTSATLLVAERRLADLAFDPATSSDIFGYLARHVIARLINFVDAVVLTKRSSEKLFKYLDMYEALNDLDRINFLNDEFSSEIFAAGDKIGGAAVYIFCDFENSIKYEAARTPVPGGAIHPLTRYVMNYIKYACEYKNILEQIFRKNKSLTRSISLAKSDGQDEISGNRKPTSSPFGVQLKTVVDLLNENLETKSQLYRDVALSYIFLMNNGRYILQKIKGSKEILQLVGDTWYRTRSTVVRQYHKNYQRETWIKLLQCLSHEGLQVNGKINKPILKERFKNFSAMFDEIHRAQSTWVVSDEQLQSELRVSISGIVIPAYRSFVGRFKQYLDSSRLPEKYIKYQPDDIETMIECLFDGNPTSMGRRR